MMTVTSTIYCHLQVSEECPRVLKRIAECREQLDTGFLADPDTPDEKVRTYILLLDYTTRLLCRLFDRILQCSADEFHSKLCSFFPLLFYFLDFFLWVVKVVGSIEWEGWGLLIHRFSSLSHIGFLVVTADLDQMFLHLSISSMIVSSYLSSTSPFHQSTFPLYLTTIVPFLFLRSSNSSARSR